MNIEKEKVDALNARLKVTVEKSDYIDNYTKSLKTYSKQANLPGFRAGKVPVGIIKKKFGKSFLAEEIQKLLDKSIHEYITKNDLKVLGQPLPVRDEENGNWDEPDSFLFTYDLGLSPEFEIAVSAKHKINYYTVKVDKKMVEEEVGRMRRRYGTLGDTDKSTASDMLIADLAELREDGLEKEDGIRNNSTIALEYIEDKKTKKKLTGVKVGDVVTVDPHKLSHSHDDLGRMLGISHDQVHDLGKAEFSLTVKEVKQLTPAELNEEFFAKVLPEDSPKTIEALNEQMTTGLKDHFNKDSELLFKRDINRYYNDKLKLKLPDAFLKRWIEVSGDGKNTPEQIEEGYEEYANSIKWQLIKNRVISENEIKVEFSEVQSHAKDLLKQNYMQYGMPAPPEEELNEYANQYLQNREQLEQIFDMMYETKVIAHVKDNAKLNNKEVSFDKFKDIASK